MSSKGKYIGLNQRIPFEVLDAAVHHYLLTGKVEKTYIYERMLEFTKGPNRAQKGTIYAFQTLNRNELILQSFRKQVDAGEYTSLKTDDRKALSLCLICLTFPITYDLLIAMSQGLKVQEQINKKFISEKVMSIYGSNRTVDIAIDALIPMIIELSTINRVKLGIYSFGSKLVVHNTFISELIVYTHILLSGTKSMLIDEIEHKPWYVYFDLTAVTPLIYKYLLTKKDSSVGKGYVNIKK
jgi:hypothetical protein